MYGNESIVFGSIFRNEDFYGHILGYHMKPKIPFLAVCLCACASVISVTLKQITAD